MKFQITSNSTVSSTVCSQKQQKKHQNFAVLALCEGNPMVTNNEGSVSISSVIIPADLEYDKYTILVVQGPELLCNFYVKIHVS